MCHIVIMMMASSFDFRSNRQIPRNSNGEKANLLPSNEWLPFLLFGLSYLFTRHVSYMHKIRMFRRSS